MKIQMTAPLEVGLCCCDLTAMRNFYEGLLGFNFIGEITVPTGIASTIGLCSGGYQVARLQTPYGERLKLLVPESLPEFVPAERYILDTHRGTYLTFIVNNLDDMVQQLVEEGVVMMSGSEAMEIRPGTRVAFCRDPEGNAIELVQVDDLAAYRPDLKDVDLGE